MPQVFDLSSWTRIALTGLDRKSYLHSFCTNDIKKLEEHQVCEAFVPDIKGRILGHVYVVNEPDQLLLLAAPGTQHQLVPHLSKYLLGVEVEVKDVSANTGLMCLVEAEHLVGRQLMPASEFNRSARCSELGAEIIGLRVDLTNLTTYLLYGPHLAIQAALQVLQNEGCSLGGLAEFDRFRIEAGFPQSGVDVTEANIVQEAARTERTISFTKGCYLGQEPIARLDAMGHTNRELRGFHISGSEIPVGSKILVDEKEVGTLSSVANRGDGTSVALGMIRTKHAAPGNAVAIVGETGTFPATIFWPRLEIAGE